MKTKTKRTWEFSAMSAGKNQAKKKELLSKDEELDLIHRWQKQKDISARNELVQKNMGLVHKIANRFLWSGVEKDDLVQQGTLGMLRAIDLFDAGFDVRFSTHAISWIYQFMQRYVEYNGYGHGGIVYSLGHTINAKLRREMNRQKKLFGSVDESVLAKKLGITLKQLWEVMPFVFSPTTSLDAAIPDGSGDDWTLKDVLASPDKSPEEMAGQLEYSRVCKKLLKLARGYLTAQELRIIETRYLSDDELVTLEKVSEEYGVTRERIRQIEVKAFQKLRKLCPELKAIWEDMEGKSK